MIKAYIIILQRSSDKQIKNWGKLFYLNKMQA